MHENKFIRFVQKSPREQWQIACHFGRLVTLLTTWPPAFFAPTGSIDWGWVVPRLRNDRTTYIIGLFGSGRSYINNLITENIGERAQFFVDGVLRLHSAPTSLIYSGHATMRYLSRGQLPPAVMSGILKAVKRRFADLIFVYRHPLDTLLTNWIWWRTAIRDRRLIGGLSDVYKNTDDLCADLDQNFLEFKAFAEGDPEFFAADGCQLPGFGHYRFLSFAEFVEETELHLRFATLPLRFEDFTIDPSKEFFKILKVMSVDLDLSCVRISPPTTKPYRYLAVKDKVPRFKNFIDVLDAETKRRIEKIGYNTGV